MHNSPQQQNVCDCGVFACTNADILSADFTGLNYTQPDIPEHRLRFVHKITEGSLLSIPRKQLATKADDTSDSGNDREREMSDDDDSVDTPVKKTPVMKAVVAKKKTPVK